MVVTPAQAVARIAEAARGKRVFVQGAAAEPLALVEAWRHAPETAAGITFCGLLVPGINRVDYSALHPTARLETFLLPPEILPAVAAGRALHLPLHYSECYDHLARADFAAAIVQVSPPGADGRCSLSLCADAAGAVIGRAGLVIGLINRAMPHIARAPGVDLSAFDLIVECDHPLPELSGAAPSAGAEAIAAHVARLVPEGASLQTGIGRLPTMILNALSNRRGLKIHSGLVGDPHMTLIESGALAGTDDAIVAGVAMGSHALYQRLPREPRLRMAAIPETHGHGVLSRIPRFTAINSALEVDLSGQVNAEIAGGRRIASVGGLVDFIRGANAAPEGRAIVALSAEGKGDVSRIVPRLSHVTVGAEDAPIVVTEYGAADLRGLDASVRADALIAVAAPRHREGLRAASV